MEFYEILNKNSVSKPNAENENEQECFQIKFLGLIRNTNTESNKNNNCLNMDTKSAKKGKAYQFFYAATLV